MSETVAVLAVQGAFIEHEHMLEGLGCNCIELREREDLNRSFDRLVLPGGESTTQGKLLRDLGMLEPIRSLIEDGMPVLGTCAGLILLSESLEQGRGSGGDMEIIRLETLPVTVCRNAYGRQLGSFHAYADFKGLGTVPMTFIRAPYVVRAREDVDVLAKVDDKIVAVRYGNQLGISFHPELDDDTRIHELFLSMEGASHRDGSTAASQGPSDARVSKVTGASLQDALSA